MEFAASDRFTGVFSGNFVALQQSRTHVDARRQRVMPVAWMNTDS
jgi:hypothetical protein